MNQYNFQESTESVENQIHEDFSGLNNVPILDFGVDFGVGNTAPTIDLDDIDEELETTNTTQLTSKRRAAKQKARCWDYFKLVQIGATADGQPIFKAVCKYCNQQFTWQKGSGTSHVNRHFPKCMQKHEGINTNQAQLQFGSPSVSTSSSHNLNNWVYSQESMRREDMCQLVASGEFPLSIVESPHFT
ncbi:BED-type domain-containing protein [Abeliophyllum distichum]|uniref:BED-type domain-containing protein n=1 Tax=Abeliophyllum distichum TaxID=126358 RepID=A0ABD1R0Q6_9LAMI